jgi:hypothetical protein
MPAKKNDDDQSLKRLGGGRWQTRDERFTIEPQSGTWVLVDAEQTDDLGLQLVRGPFRSLTDAKAAVEAARRDAAPESPLAGRVKEASGRGPKAAPTPAAKPTAKPSAKAGARASAANPARTGSPEPARKSEPPPEPRWITDLPPRDRGRARRLMERLAEAGVRDPEGVVRQDLTGGVPTIARVAVADRLAALLRADGKDPAAAARILEGLVEAVGDGRNDELDARWRLVDGEDRPIGLTAADLRAAVKRRAEARKGVIHE